MNTTTFTCECGHLYMVQIQQLQITPRVVPFQTVTQSVTIASESIQPQTESVTLAKKSRVGKK